MHNLLHIYDCPKCGKKLSDEITHGETYDCDNDEVYHLAICNDCGNEVSQRLVKNEETGQMMECFEEVDEERARWASGFYDAS